MLKKLAARLIGLAIVGLCLYFWVGALGGGSFSTGLRVSGILLAIILVGRLPTDRAWCKAAKAFVLVGCVTWVVSDFLPIKTSGEWLVSIIVAAALGLIGYAFLFEEFPEM